MQSPEFYNHEGLMDPTQFVVTEEADRVLYIWQGAATALHKVLVNGNPVPSLVGKIIQPGAAVAFMKRPTSPVGAGPGVVRGFGMVMRNGKVVRDNPTAETVISDLEYEAAYLAETTTRLRNLVESNATAETLEDYLRSRSYGDAELRARLTQEARDAAGA